MTDETYDTIVAYVKELAGDVQLFAQQGRADDDVRFDGHAITLSGADYDELRERAVAELGTTVERS